MVHQFMDRAALGQIMRNRPAIATEATSVPGAWPEGPLLLMPQRRWFAVPHAADSIHGIRHHGRVCVLAGLLAHAHGLGRTDSAALCLAAAVHDCRRHDDTADPGHGARAAAWLTNHSVAITATFGLDLPAEAVEAAKTAVGLHDIPYSAFTRADDRRYRRATRLTDLLKAADCLDRYRLAATRWWPDASHLRVQVPAWLHRIAFDLVVHSEQASLDGGTHHDALAHALVVAHQQHRQEEVHGARVRLG